MSHNDSQRGGGLSLETVVVASVASVIAMIVTSHLWKSGTVVSAAMTPVIVALASEGLRRPAKKVTQLRPPARRFTPAAGSRPSTRPAAERRFRQPSHVTGSPAERAPVQTIEERGWSGDGDGNGNGNGRSGEVRIYRPPRRNLHVKAAIVTGLVAFVIAALALTLPELIFGGSVSSSRSTTLFGGGGHARSSTRDKQTQPQKTHTQQAPAQTAPAPTTPAQTPTQTAPAQPPAQTAPAPAPQGAPPNSGSSPPAQSPSVP